MQAMKTLKHASELEKKKLKTSVALWSLFANGLICKLLRSC